MASRRGPPPSPVARGSQVFSTVRGVTVNAGDGPFSVRITGLDQFGVEVVEEMELGLGAPISIYRPPAPPLMRRRIWQRRYAERPRAFDLETTEVGWWP